MIASVKVLGMMKNKNMKIFPIFAIFFVLTQKGVLGASEHEIKRGIYPFMAVVFYSDETIVDSTGSRFSRSAVLIRPDWLISSSLETNDTQLAFPLKTLLARVGAIAIDSNFTFNEDEHEQEREIIRIVRPTSFNASLWWYNDITLLKTLQSFSMTSAVSSTTLSVKRSDMDKTCFILVYAKKYSNSSEEKLLLQLPVELLPSSNENCGKYFRKETMICASESDENKKLEYDTNFCHGNGGGPLMCDGEVIGLQTYVGHNCKQPFLYQVLSVWDDFILCGVEDKCQLSICSNLCSAIDKDDVMTFTPSKIVTTLTTENIQEMLSGHSSEDSNDDDRLMMSETTIRKITMASESEAPTPTLSSTTETTITSTTTTTTSTTVETTPIAITEGEERGTRYLESASDWPKQKEHRKKLDEADDSEKMERKIGVEAQHHEVKKKVRSAAQINISVVAGLIYSLSFGILFLTY